MAMNTIRRDFLARAAAGVMLPILGECAYAQTGWPNKPIRIVVGYPAGGLLDVFARTYGDVISRKIGQPILVENKTGAAGSLAAVDVKRAPPDGYTWHFTNSGTMIMNRVMMKAVPYDTEKDFILASIIPVGGQLFVASAKSGVRNIREFVDYCRKNDKVNVGTYAAGSFAHMAIVELNKQFNLKIEPVHYRGEAPMWTDLASQTIDGAIGSSPQSVLDAGRGRVIAVSRRRNPQMRDVLTFHEQGVTSRVFQLTAFHSCSLPAGTPLEIVKRISELMVEAGKDDKVQAVLKSMGLDETAMPFEASRKLYDEEKPIWLEVFKQLNIEPV